jgi:ribulose-phosphate 3-epimerase
MTRRVMPPGLQIAPSLLSADFARLAEEIGTIEDAGATILHLDVMDGHFVPNITFGPPLVSSVRRTTELFLDTHLMIRSPLAFLEPFAQAGADLLTLHAEALEAGGPRATPSAAGVANFQSAQEICRDCGVGIGLSFRPATEPFPWLEAVGRHLDLLLIMTVEPGFGGQAFMESMLARIRDCRRTIAHQGWRCRVEVDGGIAPATVGRAAEAGAEILVAGSAVFGQADRRASMAELLRAASGPVGR